MADQKKTILKTGGGTALMDPADCAMLLLDHQTGLFQTVKDISVAELRANTFALAKVATLLELPVITIVYNNHAYSGPHSRVIEKVPFGRMVETRQFVHDYLGKPDMNMAYIARGFGVDAEQAHSPVELRAALERAKRATREGKPYLIDAQTARTGVAWADTPWTPQLR